MPESLPHRNGSRSLPSRETIARNSAGSRIGESIGTQLDPVAHDEDVQEFLESERGVEALRFAKARHCQKLSYLPLDETTMHGSIVDRPVEGEPDLHINLSSFVGERPIETTIACYRSKSLGSKAYEELSDIGTVMGKRLSISQDAQTVINKQFDAWDAAKHAMYHALSERGLADPVNRSCSVWGRVEADAHEGAVTIHFDGSRNSRGRPSVLMRFKNGELNLDPADTCAFMEGPIQDE